ncbi:hypothetical protein [Burkholderia cenocepacia]|uniref:hypothetical protein n=1 Tax=Burkholderia cenocepacia TaxID=95486 RepID=UPI00190628A2|nr:hypothetical protein [Burkholderia cenocepacia]MBJ9695768.1 hypothetical protein [Burkholderia cenocepacia]
MKHDEKPKRSKFNNAEFAIYAIVMTVVVLMVSSHFSSPTSTTPAPQSSTSK